MSTETESLVRFLVRAKKSTYAAQGDEASVIPVLSGSKQLEYTSYPFHYRDVYFGSTRFSGQEVVYRVGCPVWSMVYCGGMDDLETDLTLETYMFLRSALSAVSEDSPYRGPRSHTAGQLVYFNDVHGSAEEFWGSEWIEKAGVRIYHLRYSGGTLC